MPRVLDEIQAAEFHHEKHETARNQQPEKRLLMRGIFFFRDFSCVSW
jgi:hypothetical protein